MSIVNKIFENKEVREYMKSHVRNNWTGTHFEDYPKLGAKQKGGFGELYVEHLMRSLGHEVELPKNTGHDRIIDKIKTEIKFSLAGSNTKKDKKLIDPDSFTFNHIAMEKDWDQFIFLGINPDFDNPNVRPFENKTWPTHRLYMMEKKDFIKYMKSGNNDVFSHQQGGNKSDNDDYCVLGRNAFYKLIKLPFVKEVSLEVQDAAAK